MLGTEAGRPDLLEREDELGRIAARMQEAAAGAGSLVLVDGPAGIGKSRLLAAARARALDVGVRVLTARGSELETGFPFGICRQLFEPALARAGADERARALAGPADLAAGLVAGHPAAGSPPGADPAFALLHGLFWLTANLAGERPLALVVDDAHWADAGSLRFLAYLAHRLDGLPVLAIVAARPADDTLLPALTTAAGEVVSLAPLGRAATAAVVAARLGAPTGDELAAACQAVTGGNPFLVHELAGALASERGAASPARVRELRPAAVSRAALARLGQLPEGARALAQAVAALGDGVELRRAARLAGLDGEEEAAALAELLADHDLLRRGRPLGFVHPLVASVIGEDISPADRARIHARAARELAADGADPEQVAAQLLLAEPAADPWVVDRLEQAAARAAAAGSPDQAVRLLTRAMREPPEPARRAALLFALGAAEARCPDEPDAISHLTAAVELAAPGFERAICAAELGQTLFVAGRIAETVDVLDTALRELDDSMSAIGHVFQGALLSASYGAPDARRLVAARPWRFRGPDATDAVPAPAGPGDRAWLAVRALEYGLSPGATAAHAGALARAALDEGAFLDEQTAHSPVYYLAVFTLLLADDLDVAHAALTDALGDARRRGSLPGVAMAACARTTANHWRGAIPEAIADGRTALEGLAGGGVPLGQPAICAFLADALIEAGELADAKEVLATARDGGTARESILFDFLLATEGRLALAQGRPEQALDGALACGRRQLAWPVEAPVLTSWRSDAALALAALGRTDEALALAEEELRRARAWAGPRPLSIALRRTGSLRGGAAGEALLREAVAVAGASPIALEHARALVDLGAHLRRSGARAAARDPLREGLAAARRAGAYALAERAHEELTATGARPRKIIRSGAESLTPSERRVARMAASGASNRDIAAALFVTVRTVEAHLNHAYMKLGITGRAELARALG